MASTTSRAERVPPTTDAAREALAAADRLVAAGRRGEAVEVLTRANRAEPDPGVEVRLVELRHLAAAAATGRAPEGAWPPAAPDRFGDLHESIPEIPARDLDPEALTSALVHHGSLLVRGFLSAPVAGSILAEVRRAFDAAAAAAAGSPIEQTAPWYVPFVPGPGFEIPAGSRQFVFKVGSVLAVDAPRALFQLVEAYRAMGLGELLAAHLGEWPALSARKTTLRRAGPDSPTEWHQDGSFLGSDIRSVNVWTALTPCGVDAPAVEVVPRRLDDLVATGTDDAAFDWSVSPTAVRRHGLEHTAHPVFAPGDALLFDQLTLHRSGVRPGMTATRYACESWFFAPSTYPGDQIPILF